MKKFFLFILFAFGLCLSVSAQNIIPDYPHYRFRGIEINGSEAAFCDSLLNLGYVYEGKRPGHLVGDFAGVPGSRIVVYSKYNFVWKVTVCFPVQNSWSMVRQLYDKFKSSYSSKLGIEPSVIEKLSYRYKAGTGTEEWGFEDQSSEWSSTFVMPDGTVVLSVRFDPKTKKMYLGVDYIDRINSIVKEQIEMEDI